MGPSQTSNFAKIRLQLSLSLSVRVAERCTTNIWLVKLCTKYIPCKIFIWFFTAESWSEAGATIEICMKYEMKIKAVRNILAAATVCSVVVS